MDGQRFFSLEEDQVLRQQVQSEKAQLIQIILEAANGVGSQ